MLFHPPEHQKIHKDEIELYTLMIKFYTTGLTDEDEQRMWRLKDEARFRHNVLTIEERRQLDES